MNEVRWTPKDQNDCMPTALAPHMCKCFSRGEVQFGTIERLRGCPTIEQKASDKCRYYLGWAWSHCNGCKGMRTGSHACRGPVTGLQIMLRRHHSPTFALQRWSPAEDPQSCCRFQLVRQRHHPTGLVRRAAKCAGAGRTGVERDTAPGCAPEVFWVRKPAHVPVQHRSLDGCSHPVRTCSESSGDGKDADLLAMP